MTDEEIAQQKSALEQYEAEAEASATGGQEDEGPDKCYQCLEPENEERGRFLDCGRKGCKKFAHEIECYLHGKYPKNEATKWKWFCRDHYPEGDYGAPPPNKDQNMEWADSDADPEDLGGDDDAEDPEVVVDTVDENVIADNPSAEEPPGTPRIGPAEQQIEDEVAQGLRCEKCRSKDHEEPHWRLCNIRDCPIWVHTKASCSFLQANRKVSRKWKFYCTEHQDYTTPRSLGHTDDDYSDSSSSDDDDDGAAPDPTSAPKRKRDDHSSDDSYGEDTARQSTKTPKKVTRQQSQLQQTPGSDRTTRRSATAANTQATSVVDTSDDAAVRPRRDRERTRQQSGVDSAASDVEGRGAQVNRSSHKIRIATTSTAQTAMKPPPRPLNSASAKNNEKHKDADQFLSTDKCHYCGDPAEYGWGKKGELVPCKKWRNGCKNLTHRDAQCARLPEDLETGQDWFCLLHRKTVGASGGRPGPAAKPPGGGSGGGDEGSKKDESSANEGDDRVQEAGRARATARAALKKANHTPKKVAASEIVISDDKSSSNSEADQPPPPFAKSVKQESAHKSNKHHPLPQTDPPKTTKPAPKLVANNTPSDLLNISDSEEGSEPHKRITPPGLTPAEIKKEHHHRRISKTFGLSNNKRKSRTSTPQPDSRSKQSTEILLKKLPSAGGGRRGEAEKLAAFVKGRQSVQVEDGSDGSEIQKSAARKRKTVSDDDEAREKKSRKVSVAPMNGVVMIADND